MKQYKKYSSELKKEILDRFSAGETALNLVIEYKLSTPALIYQWQKAVQNNACDLELIDKNAIKIKFLEDQLKIMEKKLSVKDKELQKEQLRAEFLKKHIPSDKKFCLREMKNLLSSKYVKNKAFNYIEEFKTVYSVKYMCEFLPVTRQAYYKWIKASKKRLVKSNLGRDDAILNEIKKFYDEFNIISGAAIIKTYVDNNLNASVGIHKIRKLNEKIIGAIKWKTEKSKSHKSDYDTHEKLIRPDYINNNYFTEGKFQKLGMDGTWFNECLVNGEKCVLMFELAYDLYDGTVVAYKPDYTENKYVVGEVLLDVIKRTRSSEQIIYIQTDRGRANASYLVKMIEDNSALKLSMSNAGFKHNAPTESLNGWIKEKFYHTYGKTFKSEKELLNKFDEFIKNWNKLKLYLQLKKPKPIKVLGV